MIARCNKIDFYFYFLNIFHLTIVITAMTFTSRMILFDLSLFMHPFYVTGGVFIIPATFFIQDIVTEIYGYYNARKMLYINLGIFVVYALGLYLTSLIPCDFGDYGCLSLAKISSTLPRHAISFVISMAVGGSINNYVLSRLSLAFNERFLALRFISSTAIGEAFFQIIAVIISWYGTHPLGDILPLALMAYIYKIFFEVLMTPINLYFCNYLKSIQTKDQIHAFRRGYKKFILKE
ncbi:queuosine precursor transporter [Fluoribacter gormanii]|uniref:queuosine precursor transporter n=1 Tax=Fluoribacter gormanii TaxID=464 RepID=UPI001041B27E|nr:queuosine precursor transporter [Fluoribacter gormanii]